MSPPKFFITGLPRSRTAWFAAYFCGLGRSCIHEGFKGGELSIMDDFDGNSDSGLMTQEWQTVFPDARVVLICRPITEVYWSLRAKGIWYSVDKLVMDWEKFLDVKSLMIPYDSIDDRLQEITEYCGVDYNDDIATIFKRLNIQRRL